jgi:hypothetical protein
MIAYKYYSLSQYHIQALGNDHFYMANPVEFNDPFELLHRIKVPHFESDDDARSYISELLEKISASPVQITSALTQYERGDGSFDMAKCLSHIENIYLEHLEDRRLDKELGGALGVTCFCRRPDNETLWTYYGDGLRGICVQFDLSSESPLELYDDVNYDNTESPQIPFTGGLEKETIDGLARLLFRKHPRYSPEEEIRLVASRDELTEGIYRKYTCSSIRSITFGEKTSVVNEKMIRKLFSGKNYEHITYHKAKVRREDYSIGIEDL